MEQLWSLMPTFMEGFRVTLILLVVAGVLSLILGTLIAAMRISPVAALRGFAALWTEVARNTPLTLVFFFTAFVMPMLGLRAPYILLAFVALTYYTSPFVAEALRSGINGVPIGQAEAARSIGLGFGQTVSLVVLPQAFRAVVPPMGNIFIALVKNTSVASAFSNYELISAMRNLIEQNGNAVISILVGITAAYVLLVAVVALAFNLLERSVGVPA